MTIIRNKEQYYQLYKNLALGNRVQIFENIDEFLKSDFKGLISIRYKEPSHNYAKFYVLSEKVLDTVNNFLSNGAQLHLFTFNESTPDDKLLIQGEICYFNGDFVLTYNTEKCSMRKALQHPLELKNLQAKLLLKYYMKPKSYTMIEDLLDNYPDNVIEFGTYSCNLGILPGHNTIIWELRSY